MKDGLVSGRPPQSTDSRRQPGSRSARRSSPAQTRSLRAPAQPAAGLNSGTSLSRRACPTRHKSRCRPPRSRQLFALPTGRSAGAGPGLLP
eukprot:104371-Alexandrium_andersonii.AAC.1